MKTKATTKAIQGIEKELELKSTTASHGQLVSVVDGLQEKLDDAEKTANADQTVVRLLIKEKASSADLHQLQTELKSKVSEDFEKLASQIREKGNSADFNDRISEVLNEVQEKASTAEVDRSTNELRQKLTKMASDVSEKITMVDLARIVNELKEKAPVSDVKELRSDFDNREQNFLAKAKKQDEELKKVIEESRVPLIEQLDYLKSEVNTIKLNIIATGQVEPGFTSQQGMNLAAEVAKLSQKLETAIVDNQKQMEKTRNEATRGSDEVMKETRSVFDAILKDVELLQDETEKLKQSTALEELENHLTEKIQALSENNLDMNGAQREANKALLERFDVVDQRIQEERRKSKLELDDEMQKLNNHVALMCDQTLKSAMNSAEYRIKQLENIGNDQKKKLEQRVEDKKIHDRIDELTDYYQHINKALESLSNKVNKVAEHSQGRNVPSGLTQYSIQPPQNSINHQSSLPPIHQDMMSPHSPNVQ